METSDVDKKLEEIKNLEQENNKMIKNINRSIMLSRLLAVVRWIIIVGGTVGIFYYFQPMIDQLWSTYNEMINQISGLPR